MIQINLHTYSQPLEASVHTIPEKDLAWLKLKNDSGSICVLVDMARADAMRRAAAAINEAFTDTERREEAAA